MNLLPTEIQSTTKDDQVVIAGVSSKEQKLQGLFTYTNTRTSHLVVVIRDPINIPEGNQDDARKIPSLKPCS